MFIASSRPWRLHSAWGDSERSVGRRRRDRAARPSCDLLEDRVTPSTFLVTNALDPMGRLVPGSLRRAVERANRSSSPDPVVEITSAAGSAIALHAGELRIRASLTIENASGAPVAIRQDAPNARVAHVVAGPRATAVTITGESAASALTLTGGNVRNGNGGGILVDNPQNTLTLAYVNLEGNAAAQVRNPRLGTGGNGGGIYSRGTVTLDHSIVSSNRASGPNAATGHAGGVYTDQGITLVASQVNSNTSRNDAGIFNVLGSVEVLNGSTVDNNASSGHSFATGDLGGGGIGEVAGNVLISDSQVNHNTSAGMYSGGIVILLGGVTVTDGSQIDGNRNTFAGGGIAANFEGSVTISGGSQVDGNTASGLGGGIVNFSSTFGINIIDRSEVANNTLDNSANFEETAGLIQVGLNPTVRRPFVAGGRGDALLTAAFQLFANACSQRAALLQQAVNAIPNSATTQVGGGIAEALGGPVEVGGGSTISGNHFARTTGAAELGIGGGVFANLGPVTIDGSTISGNQATGAGGGIWSGASLTISNSTVTGNQAANLGGGIFHKGKYQSTNSTISSNRPDDVYPQS